MACFFPLTAGIIPGQGAQEGIILLIRSPETVRASQQEQPVSGTVAVFVRIIRDIHQEPGGECEAAEQTAFQQIPENERSFFKCWNC